MTSLQILQQAADLTATMLQHAQAQEWEALTAAEQKRAVMLAGLAAASNNQAEAAQMRLLIEQILTTDQAIRSRVEPWMQDVKTLLSALQRPSTAK